MRVTIEAGMRSVRFRVPVVTIRFSTPRQRQQARSRARWERFKLQAARGER